VFETDLNHGQTACGGFVFLQVIAGQLVAVFLHGFWPGEKTMIPEISLITTIPPGGPAAGVAGRKAGEGCR
jgi:hypothetical protein